MENIRELILDMLMEILEKGAYSHLVVRDVLNKYDYIDSRDKAFVKRVTEGTLERMIQIDYVLDQFSKVPVSRMKPLIRNLMRMSVYQLLFMDSIPDSAVCNEAVKLAGKRGFRGLSGFVNGVLRNIARNKQKVSYPHREKEKCKYLSVWYSMPEWLIEMWISAYGEEKTLLILEELLKEHPVTVRLKESLSKEQRDKWLADLAKEGIKVKQHCYLPYAYQLSSVEGVKKLSGYEKGYFVVQDVSSMLVTEAAGISAREQIQISDDIPEAVQADTGLTDTDQKVLAVDVCAAPGGKSLHMAEKLGGKGKVLSRDLTEYKVSLIRDNIERMGYEDIDAQVYDATVLDEGLVGKADVVLADLPCSGLGIMGKKRDIKYRMNEKALKELEQLQRKILDVVWQYVKPGGTLIYSTCTINPGENNKMMEWFTKNYPFELQSLAPFLPRPLKEEGAGGMLQLFPGIHETDGFFLARLKRI